MLNIAEIGTGKQGSALTIGTLNICRARELAGSREIGFLVQLFGETGTSADDVGHASLARFENVLAIHRKTLLVSDHVGDAEILFFLTPSDGEGVVGPQSDRRNVEVSVLAGAEGPGTGHADCDAESIARKDLDIGLSSTVSDITLDETEETPGALHDPKGNNTVQHPLVNHAVQMNPHTSNSDASGDNVAVQENLVERMAHWGGGLDQNEHKGYCANKTSHDESATSD